MSGTSEPKLPRIGLLYFQEYNCLPLSLKNHSKQPTSTCTLTKPVDSRSHIGLLQPLQHIHCTSHIHKLKIHKLYNACWAARSKHAYGQKHAWEKSPVNFPLI